MTITDQLLTPNQYSRPQKPLKEVLAIIYHWTGNPKATAKANRDFFEGRKLGKDGYGSAQYIIGFEGEILRCIPEAEMAYHCGSSQVDPASGKIYTDWARENFGVYATDPVHNSPNFCTIGIELCTTDGVGNFAQPTLDAALELGVDLCKRYRLDPLKQISTHHLVVGWKDCPRLWTNKPELLTAFRQAVADKL